MTAKTIVCGFLVLTFLVVGCAPSQPIAVSEPDYWPTRDWKISPPEAQGMDSNTLAQMLEEVSAENTRIHSVLVIRNGYMVTEAYFHPYTRDTKIQIQSITKSFIGALVGIAIQNGYIKSENEKMLSYFQGRAFANPSQKKNSIRLSHLLSMSSGFPCQEFLDNGQDMNQSSGWTQFMLDLPVTTRPGSSFGYCDGNPHLLSVILEKTTGMSTREFANQALFKPLGIPTASPSDWWTDPQGFSNGGYGLHLRPIDLAKLALLYLQNGKWENQQLLPERWVADSTTQYVVKPEGPGYGYLWTVYPKTEHADHYAALGVGGQQIHIYPSQNLIVVVTADLETFMEAPEIERMLNEFILPAIQSDTALAENSNGVSRLEAAVATAENPVQPVALPAIASEISGKLYKLEENPNEWKSMLLIFEPGSNTAQVRTTESDDFDLIGLDNIYRRASLPEDQYMMRGRWIDDQTFLVEWVALPLSVNLSYNIQLKYSGENLEITIQQPVWDKQTTLIKGKR